MTAAAIPVDLDRLRRLLAKIQEDGRRLPWKVWTSCSFRRIKTGHLLGDRDDGADVLSAIKHRDGCLDLSLPEDQLTSLVDLLNEIPALLLAIEGHATAAPPPLNPLEICTLCGHQRRQHDLYTLACIHPPRFLGVSTLQPKGPAQ